MRKELLKEGHTPEYTHIYGAAEREERQDPHRSTFIWKERGRCLGTHTGIVGDGGVQASPRDDEDPEVDDLHPPRVDQAAQVAGIQRVRGRMHQGTASRGT